MNAMMYLSQLFGGMTKVWLEVTFLLCLFGILVFKSERISNQGLFRAAWTLFALSIIIPSCMMFFLDLGGSFDARRGGDFAPSMVFRLFSASGPILFGVSLICAFGSTLPKRE